MLKVTVLFIFNFLMAITTSMAIDNQLIKVRKSFHEAVLDAQRIDEFKILSDTLSDQIPVFLAYKAVSHALFAQKAWNPIDKLTHILKFQNLINHAVSADPTNLEIRFLRFSVEYYVPSWLYSEKHLIEDKDYFIHNAERISALNFDPFFTRYILVFLQETGLCSEEDSRIIQSKLAMK
ncbi:MAG: hypothetical protein RIA69_17430 [Cyclobacteriaceae bacterium]